MIATTTTIAVIATKKIIIIANWSCAANCLNEQTQNDGTIANGYYDFVHCLLFKCFLFFLTRECIIWFFCHLFCVASFIGSTVRSKCPSLLLSMLTWTSHVVIRLLFCLFWPENEHSLIKWLSRHRIALTRSPQFWSQSHKVHSQFIWYCSGNTLKNSLYRCWCFLFVCLCERESVSVVHGSRFSACKR